jgi:uncharacterized protein YecE (DUF72 family)
MPNQQPASRLQPQNSSSFRLGCAIWAYKDWLGDLFPKGSKASDFLTLYSRRFVTVEGNTTFYSTPDAATVKRWAAETPEGFEFCLKLPRTITHDGLLMPHLPEAIAFCQQMQPLGDRLGIFFAQLPPSYSPVQLADLTQFLQAVSQQMTQMKIALEVRHRDWFISPYAEQLNALLMELGVGRVVLDSRPIYDCPDDPQLYSERKKPRLPVAWDVTAEFSLVRYISHPTLELNQPYLEEWVTQVEDWLTQGKRVYFFVHCPVEARSPGNARHFQSLLEAKAVKVPGLPWNEVAAAEPSQLSLF